jgi:hypothetical protein
VTAITGLCRGISLVSYEMLTGLPAEAFPRLGQRARAIAADPVLAHLNRVAMRAARPRPRSGPE